MRNVLLALGIIAFVVFALVRRNYSLMRGGGRGQVFTPSHTPTGTQGTSVKVIAEGLDTPWGLVELPDGRILFTERIGNIRLVGSDGKLQSEPVLKVSGSYEIGEGGLLGITLHPKFSENNLIYLYYTYKESGGNTLNRVVRMTYKSGTLSDEKVIVDNIPGASNHNGGRIKFGPDGFLYITTGDAQNPSRAQDKNSLSGKILRVTDEGGKAPDNPFGNLVYSYGHRNPQGLAWDNQGRLWATEHGRSGIQSGLDELNLIEKGKNYGWPVIQGDETKEGMETPKLHSGNDTWAPSGLAFANGSFFFGGLRGQALYEVKLDGDKIVISEHFKKEFGRIRDVILSGNGNLLFTTSNQDGRGIPSSGDDKIVNVSLPIAK